MRITRRAALGLLAAPAVSRAQGAARLLVVGGGFGGASAARFARLSAPGMQVTLVEPMARFVTCPYGNLLLGGFRQIGDITHSYDGLRASASASCRTGPTASTPGRKPSGCVAAGAGLDS